MRCALTISGEVTLHNSSSTHWGRGARIYARYQSNPSLVQMMACRLVGAKPLPEPMLEIVNWTLRNKHQWNLNRDRYRSRKCLRSCRLQMAAILSRLIVLTNWGTGLEIKLPCAARKYTLSCGALRSMNFFFISFMFIYAEDTWWNEFLWRFSCATKRWCLRNIKLIHSLWGLGLG